MYQNNDHGSEQPAPGYIRSFREGHDFKAPSRGIVSYGKADTAALKVLEDHLHTENPQVREKIVDLLTDIAMQSNPAPEKGLEFIHNPQVIRILITAGLDKPDLGRERACDVLRKRALQQDLQPYQQQLKAALEQAPSDELLLLIARAKAVSAAGLVNDLSFTDKWRLSESLRIAQAALGDKHIVAEITSETEAAHAAGDAPAFSDKLRLLSLIGTPEALKTIAGYMRTALILDRPNIVQKSMRLEVMDALRYNFPDQLVLYPSSIITDADYAAAEKFCVDHFGVSYTTPRPPFMTYISYPSIR